MSPRGSSFLAALLLVALSACSSSSDPNANANAIGASGAGAAQPSDAGALPDAEVSCQSDPRVSPYALPLTLTGAQGYSVTLSARSPNPSAKGLNQWTVAAADASGAPLVGANLVFSTTMPDHGHSSPAPTAPPSDAQGNATVPGLDFFMAGVWQIQIDVYPAGAEAGADPTDSVAFWFCIEG
ncbi:MAG TPA: FixH family protein [Polyangiaceae bacterium]|jgi:hypothetical protein|nr:FixH family protein [Polyangiaceae bacterium]